MFLKMILDDIMSRYDRKENLKQVDFLEDPATPNLNMVLSG